MDGAVDARTAARVGGMPIGYILTVMWQWIADKGITLALITVAALMVPRLGRFLIREINTRIENSQEQQEGKTSLALTTAAVYIGQLVAYFLLMVFFLSTLGFSLAGAAIPATVVSAALGLGAQSIIADFLAGFFILTEKQYGINDWVRFEGSGVEVEGTVISITLRATRIRTLAQETITIPNSTPKVCVNSSQYWSRAVVTMPIPLRSSHSTEEAIDRAEDAAARALHRPEIRDDVLDELVVQPAVDVTPPSTVGTPWTMSVRLMVTSSAGAQWAVERAMRTAILDEFWDEYGAAPSLTGAPVDHDLAHNRDIAPPTALFTAAERRDAAGDGDSPAIDDVAPGTAGADGAVGAGSAVAASGGADATSEIDAQTRAMPAHSGPEARPVSPVSPEDDPAAQKQAGEDALDEDAEAERHTGLLSLGGRVRPSTTLLGVAMAVLLFLWASTVQTGEGWEGSDGWLAPRTDDTVSSTPETTQEQTVEESYPETTQPTTTAGTAEQTPEDQATPTPGEGAGQTEPQRPDQQDRSPNQNSQTSVAPTEQPAEPTGNQADPDARSGSGVGGGATAD